MRRSMPSISTAPTIRRRRAPISPRPKRKPPHTASTAPCSWRTRLEVAKTPEDRGTLAPAVGRYALDIGLGKAARAAFAVLAESATQPARCRGLIGLAASDRMLAAIPQAMESLAAAEPIAIGLDDPALLSEIFYLRGNLHFRARPGG
jgi:hypothetical protein